MRKPVIGLLERRSALVTAAIVAAVVVAACGREPTMSGPTGRATLQLDPLFQTGTTGRVADSVTKLRWRVSKVSPAPSAVIADVVQPFVDNGDTPDSLTVTFPLQGADAEYEVVIKALGVLGDTLFQVGPLHFSASDLSASGVVHLQVAESSILYIGPGSEATRIVASPHTVNLGPGQTFQLTATAFGPTGAALPRALFDWFTATNNGVAQVDGSGKVFAQNKRGTELIVVAIPSARLPMDSVVVNVSLGASQVVLVSGAGQTATVNTQLANPIVVRVLASDGVPVPGANVIFTPAGGSVTATSVTTASDGTAQTRWTLGAIAGTQALAVSVVGVPGAVLGVTATATAVPLTPTSIQFLSVLPTAIAAGQTAAIVVQVNGASGPLNGATVTFTSTGTGNTFTPPSNTTLANGQTAVAFTSTVPETKTITATSGTVSATTTLPVAPATTSAVTLVKVSGDNQVVQYGTTYPQPLVVRALNAQGQPVFGALVDWGTASGAARKVTDSNGLSSNLYFLPNDPITYPPNNPNLPISVTLVGTTAVVIFHYTAVP